MDSGASRLMTGTLHLLKNVKYIRGGYVGFVGNHGGPIVGEGTLSNGKVMLENVNYITELENNLLSISQICDKGFSTHFTSQDCQIMKSGFNIPEYWILVKAPRENDLYVLNMSVSSSTQGTIQCFVTKASENGFVLWHRRMGHINVCKMNYLVSNELVEESVEGFFVGYASPLRRVFLPSINQIMQVQHVDCQRYATPVQRKGDSWMFDYDSLWSCFSFPEEEITDETATLLFQQHLGEGFHEENNTQDVPIFNDDPSPAVDEPFNDTPATPSFDDNGEDHDDVIESLVQPTPNFDVVISDEAVSEENVTNLRNDVVVPDEVIPLQRDENGIIVRNKARLVVLGFNQRKGIDYNEVYAPVARLESIGIFLAFASWKGFKVYKLDVKSAFLNGKLGEEVYVGQLQGFVDPIHKYKVYLLDKAFYGLHQAPRAWYETLPQHLLDNSFVRGTVDCTLFTKEVDGHLLILQVYVDDIIFGSIKNVLCKEFEEVMKSNFEMSAMGELKFFLGLQVEQMSDGIFIHQTKYVKDILEKFNMADSTPISTPIPLNY
ncbi:uncharacterized protein LOC143567526 [Bidens hawaiensis]|uniref:uncharacterized protein LOC143567526 n=1 Tax=Bidens hawaiensis TaxID=980011 RepID=UPI00404A7BEB